MIKQFKKKPVIIEAMQLENTKESFEEAYKWIGENVELTWATDGSFINIKTLEGVHQARVGDYIIKGVKGEFYPCKPDIFEMTYEEVK
jgi:hypothetical protein